MDLRVTVHNLYIRQCLEKIIKTKVNTQNYTNSYDIN